MWPEDRTPLKPAYCFTMNRISPYSQLSTVPAECDPANVTLLTKNLTHNKMNCRNKKSHYKGNASVRIFNILPMWTRTRSEFLPEIYLSKLCYKYTAIK